MKNSSKLLAIAKAVSELSKDTTKIGAVAVDSDNRILGVGFNGYPPGYDDADISDKYDKVIHAEMNAIFNSRSQRGDIRTMYIYGLPPCPDCMKHLAAFGIKNVVFQTNNDIKSSKEWVSKHKAKCHLHNLKVIEL